MHKTSLECRGPLSEWADLLVSWMAERGVCSERSARTIRTFARFSSWMSDRQLSLADLDENLVDDYIEAERQRSGSQVPAAFQYLPLVKRFFADQGIMVLRGPVSRDRHGIPRLQSGPLAGSIVDLVAWLKAEGYARGTATSVTCTAARLSAWMATEGLKVERLDDALLTRFVSAQTHGRVRHPSSARRIVTVRKFLLAAGLLTESTSRVEVPTAAPAQECLDGWAHYLSGERGLGAATIREYRRWVEAFVNQMVGPDGSIRWDQLETRMVNRYVTEQGHGYALASRRHLVTAVRSLLTWAWCTGLVDRPMAAMVLRPPTRRADLPRALTPGQVEAIEAAADTNTPIGSRDYAVVVMIARLGLRAGGVASLRLNDLDWHHGHLTVRGKGHRVLLLPLPVDVGEALVGYLRDGRPAGAADRAVFIRARPPLVGLSSKGISGVVARLAQRAGLGTVHAHRLRHTTATQVLARGGSLVEARELLGHARTDTTMIYAREDRPRRTRRAGRAVGHRPRCPAPNASQGPAGSAVMNTKATRDTSPDRSPVLPAEITLRQRLDEYLLMRRALGFQLDALEMLAGRFCDWLTAQDKATFTTADAVAWARLPTDANPIWWGMRLGAVRTFAAYLHATGVDVEVPPRGILPARSGRAVPFIYSQADLDALLACCPEVFTHGFVADTMRTLIGLLAATGIRIGEALRFTPTDIDTDGDLGVLLIRRSKNGASRLVPLHPTTTGQLMAYRDLPARRRTRPARDAPLFVSRRGTGYNRSTIELYFARMVTAAGLTPRGRARPRVHDIRHTFATAHMTAAYQTGADPQRTLTLLATWLGHTSAAHTYWYLTATPDLMALAADRLEPPPRP